MNRLPPALAMNQCGSASVIMLIIMTLGLGTTGYFLYDSHNAQDVLNAQLDRTQKRLRFAQRDLREKEESLSEQESERYRLESQRRSLKQEITDIQKEMEKFRAESKAKDALEQKLSSKENEYQQHLQQLKSTESHYQQQLSDLNSGYEKQLSDLNSGYEKQLADLNRSSEALNQKYQQSRQQYHSTQEQLDIERSRIEDFSNKIETLEQRLAREQEALTQLNQKLSLLDKKNNELKAEKKRLVKQFEDGTTIIRLEDTILFPSGSATLNQHGQNTLMLVADTLRSFPRHLISVEGHTDQKPIISALSKKYPSNWELSAARASYAIRYLTEKGLPEAQFQAVGYGSTRPIATGKSVKAQEKNRRIEILLYPPDEKVSVDSLPLGTNKLDSN